MAHALRIERLRRVLDEKRLDALLVTQPHNVHYLTGFRPMMFNVVQPIDDPEGLVLVERERTTFFCDDRYDATPAKRSGAEHGRIQAPGGVAALGDAMQPRLAERVKRIGFEAGGLLYSDASGLMARFPKIEWVPADDVVLGLRLCKDATELDLLRQAAKITDDAYTHVLQHLKVGMTEREVADVIDGHLRKHSEGPSFNTIVGFGPSGAAPHYEPSRSIRLKKGDMVLMDFGSIHHGYMGDMTRMAVMGPADGKQKEVYRQVLEAQMAVLAGLKPGITGNDADDLARGVFRKHGVLDKFLHGTGHGIGLAVHEPPRLKPSLTNKLVPGTVFSVEPGLYEVGWGGVRIEDLVIMGETGAENITHSPKNDLISVAC